MLGELNKQVIDIYKTFYNQVADINKLNSEVIEEVSKKAHLDEMMNVQKPEDLIAAQLKFLTEANVRTIQYLQDISAILLHTSTEINSRFASLAGNAVASGNEFARKAANVAKGEK